MPAIIFLGLLTSSTLPSAHAAPLPTNIATMNSMSSGNVVQARWGGWRGGWGYRGFGYRGGWGYGRRVYGGWGYGGWGLGAAAAGAIVGGAIASSAYDGGYPYYDGGYAYDSCPTSYGYGYGYGGYSPAYYGYPYRGYYSGW